MEGGGGGGGGNLNPVYLHMQLQTVQQYKQEEDMKQSGHPLKKMTTMLASPHENSKQSE